MSIRNMIIYQKPLISHHIDNIRKTG